MAAVIYTSGRRGAVFLSIRGADVESCFRQADEGVQFRVSSRCAAEETFPILTETSQQAANIRTAVLFGCLVNLVPRRQMFLWGGR